MSFREELLDNYLMIVEVLYGGQDCCAHREMLWVYGLDIRNLDEDIYVGYLACLDCSKYQNIPRNWITI